MDFFKVIYQENVILWSEAQSHSMFLEIMKFAYSIGR